MCMFDRLRSLSTWRYQRSRTKVMIKTKQWLKTRGYTIRDPNTFLQIYNLYTSFLLLPV